MTAPNEPTREIATRLMALNPDGLAAAAKVLSAGGLVAFPTETVYGLGGDAGSDVAVAKIFAAKGRPQFNPLIVHVPDLRAAGRIVEFTPMAERLADMFWPGALTMVLKRKPKARLSRLVSAGLDTVAIRIPAHGGARDLLRVVDRPIAAPSANASGRLSPVTADHVMKSLGGKIDLILDGGPCRVGVESTIVDVSGDEPVLLRPGGVGREALETALGRRLLRYSAHEEDGETARLSPGLLKSHYAPGLPVSLNVPAPCDGRAYLGFGAPKAGEVANLSPTGDVVEAAANLFRLLHELDDADRYSGIDVAPIPDEGLGLAINDRLDRAAADRS